MAACAVGRSAATHRFGGVWDCGSGGVGVWEVKDKLFERDV
jgi:hypothetical protein